MSVLAFGLEGPWYVQLGIVAATLTSLKVIWDRIGRYIVSTIWDAFKAAPRLRDAAEDLVQLIEGDVLHRMDDIANGLRSVEVHNAAQDGRLDASEQTLALHAARLDAHDRALAAISGRSEPEHGAQ